MHKNREIREVPTPDVPLHQAWCECGFLGLKRATRTQADLDIADHLVSVLEDALKTPYKPQIADNFVDTRKDPKPETRSAHDWYTNHEVGRNYG